MAVTKKEIEAEIAELSAFINRQIEKTQQFMDKLEIYSQNREIVSRLITTFKPIVKQKSLNLEIALLKTRLGILERLIARKMRMESDEGS